MLPVSMFININLKAVVSYLVDVLSVSLFINLVMSMFIALLLFVVIILGPRSPSYGVVYVGAYICCFIALNCMYW